MYLWDCSSEKREQEQACVIDSFALLFVVLLYSLNYRLKNAAIPCFQ